ncbi:hypothetical protein L6164_009815 [Bauhinia variegata]|uniref:Uncharacterized protein n=1 Tax=Bauhinia variegata TaxID=167791 RepID=A0ACB9PL75_BAUVA|nr:hypothetical protein L6164_009815 [Bauhinia variegata]
MGRKGNWFSSVKKALSPESKEKKDQKSNKSKKKWFGKQKLQTSDSCLETDKSPPPLPPPEEIKLTDIENENSHAHGHVVEVATAVDAEEPVPAVQIEPVPVPVPVAAVARVQAARLAQFVGKSREEVAAIKIQTAFRGYLARRALRALRGLVRLKALMEGPIVKRQATSTLRTMQTLSRVQSQIRSRRMRMLEENQALQRQLMQKHAKELESLRIEEEWDDSLQSKEQIEAKLFGKYEAAMRRERALAYAYSHQQTWKNTSKSINPFFMDPTNPAWGWSWLERWTAARPGESRSQMEKEEVSSVRGSSRSLTAAEIIKSYARYQLNSEKHSPTASQTPGSPSFKPQSTPSKAASSSSAIAKKLKKVNPKDSWAMDDDSKSMVSVQSRRHSIAGSSVRDDESLASSPSVPSYMVPTQSAKAKSRLQSPLATENGTPEKGSFGTAKKRLSFPQSPARPRRHSGPPRVGSSLNGQITVGNGVTS